VLELEPSIAQWAQRFAMKQHALVPRRGKHYPIAMEGALKLKEISYVHAEAYPPGNSSTARSPWWTRNARDQQSPPSRTPCLEKLKSNLQEVRARGGELYVFADKGTEIQESTACISSRCRNTTGCCHHHALWCRAVAVVSRGAGEGDGRG